MGLKLLSHINADGDLIEAWLKYYLRLGVDRFHLILHGTQEENDRLLAIKDSYPVPLKILTKGPLKVNRRRTVWMPYSPGIATSG